jgi:hypothetical protein
MLNCEKSLFLFCLRVVNLTLTITLTLYRELVLYAHSRRVAGKFMHFI